MMQTTRHAPVRLAGTDEQIIAVAVTARDLVASHSALHRDLMPRLAAVRSARREFTASGRHLHRAESVRDGRRGGAVWGAALVVAVIAAIIATAMYSPLGPRTRWVDPETAVQIGVPSIVIAIIASAVALIVQPAPGRAAEGEVFAGIAGTAVSFVFLFRLIAGGSDRGFSAEQLAPWLIGAAILAVILLALTWRLDRVRRGDVLGEGGLPRGDRDARARARRIRETAMAAAQLRPASADAQLQLREQWLRALRRMPMQSGSAEVLAQAEQIGPVAWLAWTVYDGDIDVSRVLAATA